MTLKFRKITRKNPMFRDRKISINFKVIDVPNGYILCDNCGADLNKNQVSIYEMKTDGRTWGVVCKTCKDSLCKLDKQLHDAKGDRV